MLVKAPALHRSSSKTHVHSFEHVYFASLSYTKVMITNHSSKPLHLTHHFLGTFYQFGTVVYPVTTTYTTYTAIGPDGDDNHRRRRSSGTRRPRCGSR